MTRIVFSINTQAYRVTGPLVGCATTREIAHALRGYGGGMDARILADDILDGRVRLTHTAEMLDGEIPEHRFQWHHEAISALIRYSEHSEQCHAWEAKDRADWLIACLASGALALVTPAESVADLVKA